MVIGDRSQAHRSAAVKVDRGQHPELMVEELPTYAPDLNPDEGCHGDAKRHLLNATPEDTRQIRQQTNRGWLFPDSGELRDQEPDQRSQQRLTSSSDVVNELEEAQVER
jgi:hypothetical protein